MEVKRSRLLVTAFPYLQIFSVFALTPPPQSFGKSSNNHLGRYLMVGYCCYALALLVLVFVVTYVNIVAIIEEVEDYKVEDFTKVMGNCQKMLLSIMSITNHLNMLFNFRRLGRIYEDIADLEAKIDDASQCFGGQKHRISFRFRLAIGVGLWLILLVGLLPRFTLLAMGPYINWPCKIITEFVLVMQQLKSLEYCVFVLLIHELVLRLRHTLLQLKMELMDCDRQDMLRALSVALKRNQLLIGQVWRVGVELGTYFTLPMIMLFLYNGLTILHVTNWAYINTFYDDDCCRYDRFGTCILLILNLLLVCFLSQRCTDAYNSFPRILHQIRCLSAVTDFQPLNMGIREYSLQTQHLRLLFTCGGFFDINLKYFGGMVITILGYTIILIQFKIQAIAETKYRSSLNSST
ncbi:putative gustatory receptor 98b [Drosophila serrata]|uniref:putative gustatory receptor 98b n=1 Tax=Drosophila serrata TaxID=7274 RepID=UPI000A1D38EF|nr:putative gustatory receptor 98b [Drosophila serrata]